MASPGGSCLEAGGVVGGTRELHRAVTAGAAAGGERGARRKDQRKSEGPGVMVDNREVAVAVAAAAKPSEALQRSSRRGMR